MKNEGYYQQEILLKLFKTLEFKITVSLHTRYSEKIIQHIIDISRAQFLKVLEEQLRKSDPPMTDEDISKLYREGWPKDRPISPEATESFQKLLKLVWDQAELDFLRICAEQTLRAIENQPEKPESDGSIPAGMLIK